VQASNWPNAVSAYYENAQVETCPVLKANFNANFNVYSDISYAGTINAVQCLVRYSVYLKVSAGLE